MKRNHKWGSLGGKLSNRKKTKTQRSADASKAAKARWSTPMKQLVRVVAGRATSANV